MCNYFKYVMHFPCRILFLSGGFWVYEVNTDLLNHFCSRSCLSCFVLREHRNSFIHHFLDSLHQSIPGSKNCKNMGIRRLAEDWPKLGRRLAEDRPKIGLTNCSRNFYLRILITC